MSKKAAGEGVREGDEIGLVVEAELFDFFVLDTAAGG